MPSRGVDGRLLDMGPQAAPGCGIPLTFVLGIVIVLALMLGAAAWALLLGPGGPLDLHRLFPGSGGGGPGGSSPTPTAAAIYRGGTGGVDLYPVISARDFTGGNAPMTASGVFTIVDTVALHPPASFADGTEATLTYGTYGEYGVGEGILLGFSRLEGSEGIGVNVQSGDWLAVYMGEGCSWEVEVTDISVSGHISCNDIPAYNEANGETGEVDLELDFYADSVPVLDESDT